MQTREVTVVSSWRWGVHVGIQRQSSCTPWRNCIDAGHARHPLHKSNKSRCGFRGLVRLKGRMFSTGSKTIKLENVKNAAANDPNNIVKLLTKARKTRIQVKYIYIHMS